ncbi:4a-hydroxytetrahydrobiopterin dehydratase [bacterium]|nr:4a-hydroxytetrahydrobiopterin dehydratase [bacterium]
MTTGLTNERTLLDAAGARQQLDQLDLSWQIVDGGTLRRVFMFDSFMDAMMFVNDIATVAESYNHHPDMQINYTKVVVSLTTHDKGGLTSLDFLVARQIELCC